MKNFTATLKLYILLSLKILTERLFVRERPALTMSTLKGWRYPIFLLNSFTSASVVGIHWRDVERAFEMLSLRAFLSRLRIASLMRPSQRGVLIYDPVDGRYITCTRQITIESGYYSVTPTPGLFVCPYFAHPEFYRRGLYKMTRSLASKSGTRSLRLFFSGALNKNYSRVSEFNILTRTEILTHVITMLNEESFSELRSKSEIITTADTADSVEKHALSPSAFVRRAAMTDFFICAPGFRVPHAHNMIEAMSVGAIPITNYYNFMSPPLRHGVNCLAFNTLDELSMIIEFVANIDQPRLEELRDGVRDYYYRYLDPFAVGSHFVAGINAIERIAVNREIGTISIVPATFLV